MNLPSTTTDKVRWTMDGDGAWVCFRVPTPAVAKQICECFEIGKLYELFLRIRKKARSLDANAYFWVLVGKLAARLHIPQRRFTGSMCRMLAIISRLSLLNPSTWKTGTECGARVMLDA